MSTDNPAQQEPPGTDSTQDSTSDPTSDSGADSTPGDGTGDGSATGCSDCQTGLSDAKCEAKGIEAQAKYNAESQPALVTAQATYAQARKKYREQRCLIYTEVSDLKNQAKHQLERARCLIRQEHVVDCLEKAWDAVKEELECCSKPPCCTELDCDFSADTDDLDDQQLDNLISDVSKRTAEAKSCFDELAGEPDALAQRLSDLKAEIAKINAILGDDTGKDDPKTVWAMARVAHWHAKRFWHGFDKISDFVDCLCAALKCWTNGTRTLSELKREQAVRACHKGEADLRCETVRTQTVEEILAWYDKLCPSSGCGCGCDGKDGGKGGKGEKPCGCDKHDHHHHHHDHEPCGCGKHDHDDSEHHEGSTAS